MAPTNREWEKVVLEKRKLRDEAIQKFEEEHRVRSHRLVQELLRISS